MTGKKMEGKWIVVSIVIVAVVILLYLFSTMVEVTLLDSRSIENVTLQVTLT